MGITPKEGGDVTDGLPSTLSRLHLRTTIGTVSFRFYPLPFPRVLYYHVFVLMTCLLRCTSTTFHLDDSYSYYDSTHFHTLLCCSFPRMSRFVCGLPLVCRVDCRGHLLSRYDYAGKQYLVMDWHQSAVR